MPDMQEIDFRGGSGGAREPDETVEDVGFHAHEPHPANPTVTAKAGAEGEGSKRTVELTRAAAAVSAKADALLASITEKDEADHFDATAYENMMVELSETNEDLKAAMEYDRRAGNDRERESHGPVANMDGKQMEADFRRAFYTGLRMCIEGEARGISLANRRPEEVQPGEEQGNYVSLRKGSNDILYLGEIAKTVPEMMPDLSLGAVSHDELSRFDAADSLSTDAGAPLGIIYGDVAEQNMEFLGAFCQPALTDVWYRLDRLDGAGKDLQDIDIPRINRKLTAGQATENADMTEDHSSYDEVVFSSNSIDLARNIPKKYMQKTQLFNFMQQEMIPTHQAITRLREQFIITGDGSRSVPATEGKPKGYLTALDEDANADIGVARSTANTEAGFRGTVANLDTAVNTLDVGYRGNPSTALVMHPTIWGYFSGLRSDNLRELAPFNERIDRSTMNLMLGIMGTFDGYSKVVLHPQYDTVLNAAGKIMFSYGPLKAYTFVTTDFIWVFSSEANVKKRGNYFAGYTYDDGNLRWTNVGAPVGLLAKTV